jgi:hypothetical protein
MIASALILLPLLLGAEPARAILPAEAKAVPLVDLSSPELAPRTFSLAVSRDGDPILVEGTKLAFLSAAGSDRLSFAAGRVPIDDLTVSADGALLAISGKRLGALTEAGFVPLAAVPAPHARIAAAGPGEALLFSPEARDVWVYRSNGKFERLLAAPEKVSAVASDGQRTLVALGKTVLQVAPGEPRVVEAASSPVIALALGPDGSHFSASAEGVSWVRAERRSTFFRGAVTSLVRRGDQLFVLAPGYGVVRIGPVESFPKLEEAVSAKGAKR